MIPQPRSVGPLVIERKIASDGVVETFKGTWQSEGDRPVFIRRLHDWLVRDEVLMSAVDARIGDLLALRHPRLVRILDYLNVGDERFIIEESVRGVDLMTLVQDVHALGGSLPPNVFLHFAIQLCTNLEALHNCRGSVTGDEPMLHRALRPNAVFISLEGSVRLGGYGLLPSPNLIPPKMFRGPVGARTAFLAPEQVDDGRPTTRATDIFSLGAVLYTMLTGEVLFDAKSDLQAIWAIREGNVEPKIQATRKLVPGIERVFSRCIDTKPGRRYQSVDILRDELRGLIEVYDKSRITDEVLDLLAAVGLEPPSRAAAPVLMPRPTIIEDDGDEPTANTSGSMYPEDDAGNDEATDPGLTLAMNRHTSRSPPIDFASSLLGAPLEPSSADLVDVGAEDMVRVDEDVDLEEGFVETSYVTGQQPRPAAIHVMPSPTLRFSIVSDGDDDGDLHEPSVERTARSIPVLPEVTDRIRGYVATAEVTASAASNLPPPPPGGVQVNIHSRTFSHAPATPASSGHTPAAIPLSHQALDDSEADAFPGMRTIALLVAAGLMAFVGGAFVAHLWSPDDGGETQVALSNPVVPSPPGVSPPIARPPAVASAATAPPPAVAVAQHEAPIAPPDSASTAIAAIPAPPSPKADPHPLTTREPPASADRTAALTRPTPTTSQPAPTPSSAAVIPTPSDAVGWDPPKRLVDVEGIGTRAAAGKLSTSDRAMLEGIDMNQADFTKARVWLYDDATARGVLAERKRHIDALMRLDENTYNPVFLTESAQVALAYKDYDTALARARKAEQHWARLPSQAVFNRKAMIYEQQAAAWYGIYVRSDGVDSEALNNSIRAWQRYRQHVSTRDAGLTARADQQITKLTDIQNRSPQ